MHAVNQRSNGTAVTNPKLNYRLLPCGNSDLELYWFDGDEALLHVISSGAIYPLDPTALYVWLSLEKGVGETQLVCELLELGSTEAEASRFIRQLLSLRDGNVPLESAATEVDVPDWDRVPSIAHSVKSADYRVLDVGVHLSGIGGGLLDELAEILVPCKASESQPTHLELRVEGEGDSHRIIANGYCVCDGLQAKNLMPQLLDGIRRFAYLHSGFTLALHAAALGRGDRILLMPGGSGSGKSTLSAGLMARGWGVYSDEIAVLDEPNFQLRPLPVGIGIKSGGWPVVSGYYSALAENPIHERRNGIRIRYLPITSARVAAVAQPATHLVFPCYRQGALTTMQPLSVVETTRYFQNTDYHMARPLGSDGMASFLDWLSSIPRFVMTFGELTAAMDFLESL